MSKWLQKKSKKQKKQKKFLKLARREEMRRKQMELISTFPGNLQNEITVYTDGACEPNPGPGGWGAVIIKDGMVIEIGGHEDKTTNNQMELRAALEALKFLKGTERKVKIRSDSLYVCNSCSKWVSGWQKNGWRTKSGKPVSNVDLISKISELERAIQGPITWEPVRGHFGIPGNERADEIAEGFISGQVELLNCPIEDHPYDFTKLMKPSIRKDYERNSVKRGASSDENGFDPVSFFLD